MYNWITVPAGEHLIWSSSGNVSAIKMNLEAGKSYYFEQKVKMGGLRARVELVQLPEADRADLVETADEGRVGVRAQDAISESTASAARAGSGAAVIGRPTTRNWAPAWTAARGVAMRD